MKIFFFFVVKILEDINMCVCVIGIGYVGLVMGVCLFYIGYYVICIDNNEEKVKLLKLG